MSNEFRSAVPMLQAVTCILGLEGADGLVRVAEELTVGINPYSAESPEFALCRQDFLFSYALNVPAGGAGFRSIVQLHNDSADAIVVLEPGTRFAIGGAGDILLSRTNTLATTDNGLVATARDGRYPRPSVPYVRSRQQNGVAAPAGFTNGVMFNSGAQTLLELIFPYILRPQGTIAAFPSTDNINIVASWVGRVRRVISQRELNP